MAKHLVQRIIVSHLLRAQLHLANSALSLHLEGCPSFARFSWQRRSMHKGVEVLDHTCEVTTYDEYLTNHKPIIAVMVQTLKEILGTSTSDTNKIIAANPQLKKRSRMNVLNNYYNLLEAGVQKNTIASNIWLLTHENNKLKEKLDCISVLNMNNDELIPWLRLTQEELANYVLYVQSDTGPYTYNKIEHLAHRLECSIQELCELTIRCSFILKIPVSYIDKKLNILHGYDISNKNILKDLWVFRYSEHHIRHRCELYKDTECLEIKTWAIRCPLRIITRAIQRNHTERGLLRHHKNISEYLMDKLKVDEETLRLATVKYPIILRVNLRKMDELINILYQNGITSREILQNGRIFRFNIETLKNKIEILKKENLLPRLALLMKSEESLDQYMKKNKVERELLQFQEDIEGYLMRRLNASKENVESAMKRWPHISQTNILKLALMIDMLQENGITSNDILRNGRVFDFKVETIRERLETLKTNGLTPKITVLKFDKKSFVRYVIIQTAKLIIYRERN